MSRSKMSARQKLLLQDDAKQPAVATVEPENRFAMTLPLCSSSSAFVETLAAWEHAQAGGSVVFNYAVLVGGDTVWLDRLTLMHW